MNRYASLFALAACALAPAVQADTTPTVVVSANRFDTSSYVTPAPITVISREDIATSGATTLAGLLKSRAGLQLQSFAGNGSQTAIGMRGFSGNAFGNTLVLLDGRRLNNSDIAPPDLALVNLDEIDRVEIIQGSAGTLFGDNAVGGVINIVTRQPRDTDHIVSASIGSYGALRLAAGSSVAPADGPSFGVSGYHDRADNFRRNSAHERSGLLLSLGRGAPDDRWFFEYKHAAERQELAGALTRAQRDADRRQAQVAGDFNDGTTHLARAGYHADIDADWRLALDGSYRRVDLDGVLSGLTVRQQRESIAINPRMSGFSDLAGVAAEITLGLDLEHGRYRLVSPFGFQRNDQRAAAAYVQAVATLGPTLNLTLGTRHARVWNDIADTVTFPAGARLNDDASVFTVGATWQPLPELRLHARRDGNFRFAKVDEQTDSAAGTRGLRTQTGISWEAGLDWHGPSYSLALAVFQLDIDNELDVHPTASLFGPFPANTNLDPTRRRGVMAHASTRLGPDLDLEAAYHLTDAEFRAGTFAGNRIPGVARHQASLALAWRPAPGWLLNPQVEHLSARDAVGDYANALEKVDAHTLLHLGIKRSLGPWRLGLQVNNVLDADYDLLGVRQSFPTVETAFYPAPDRHFMLILEYLTDSHR